MIQEKEELCSIDGQIECENPNPNLQSFMGRIKVGIHNHWPLERIDIPLKPLGCFTRFLRITVCPLDRVVTRNFSMEGARIKKFGALKIIIKP